MIESNLSEYIHSKINEVIVEWDLSDKLIQYTFYDDKSLLTKERPVSLYTKIYELRYSFFNFYLSYNL